MKKLGIVSLMALSAIVLAGCTPAATLKSLDKDRFTMQVPEHFKEFDANTANGELLYMSDDTADTFIEGSLSVFSYDDVVTEESKFDQTYCDDAYNFIADPASLGGFSGIKKNTVTFVAATDAKAAHCDISFELFNEDTEEFVSTQYHRQHLFVDGDDEVTIEIASTKQTMPQYMIDSLNSFKLKSSN